jgi:non-specific serine/threonine protein kinase
LAAAEQRITSEFKDITAADPHWPWMLADCYALLDQQDLALFWLQKGIDKGFLNYPMIGRWDPLLANVRHHAGFPKLLQQLRGLWEKFEV